MLDRIERLGARPQLAGAVGKKCQSVSYGKTHLPEVTKPDLDALVDQVFSVVSKHAGPDIVKDVQEGLKDFRAEAGVELSDLLEAGGRGIFAVFGMYDFPYSLWRFRFLRPVIRPDFTTTC